MDGTKYTPFELGEIAFKQGHTIYMNPYKKNTWEQTEWNAGYLSFKAAVESRIRLTSD